jgi:gamma-glutamyltranspeptidase/glutathione hydrolase
MPTSHNPNSRIAQGGREHTMSSTRPPVVAPNGVVAAAHPLAAVAGLRMLLAGGNAVDAAIATAAALNVVEPYMSGCGGDGYMMVSLKNGTRKGLDYVGPAPKGARLELYKDDFRKLHHGPLAMLVPGNMGGWLEALETYGTMDRKDVFAPAIAYAEGGFPITPKNATFIEPSLAYMDDAGKRNIAPNGRPPRAGEFIRQPELANTFRAVVEGGRDAFYTGSIAEKICADVQSRGGVLSTDDLAAFRPRWVDPLVTTYRGYEIATLPPPCCGVQYLETLNILEGFDLAAMGHGSADHLHAFMEAAKIAIADRVAYVGNPDAPVGGLASKRYAERRRAEIDMARARPSRGDRYVRYEDPAAIKAGDPAALAHEQTTSFSIIDKDGNGVSVTQSLGGGFGSGVCAGGTGVFLNNFCWWFDLDPESPNAIGPNKKLAMCVAPGHIWRDGRLHIAIGTPGGYGILQTTPQMMINLLDFGMNTQEAIEAPRLRTVLAGESDPYFQDPNPAAGDNATLCAIESRYPADTLAELERRGHHVSRLPEFAPAVGGGQGVMIDRGTGARIGGADPRRDGVAVGY